MAENVRYILIELSDINRPRVLVPRCCISAVTEITSRRMNINRQTIAPMLTDTQVINKEPAKRAEWYIYTNKTKSSNE